MIEVTFLLSQRPMTQGLKYETSCDYIFKNSTFPMNLVAYI